MTPTSPASPAENLGSLETTAERRPLSVMFCDLIGSTALSSRLDPEDLREVIRTYQSCVANTIQQFDGFIARYVGDGVLIYFGWPEARETDAERAVRAGLAVAAAVSKVPWAASRYRSALASQRDWWSSASRLAPATLVSRRRSVKRRTSRPAYRASLGLGRWSSMLPPAGRSAACSSVATSAHVELKGLPGAGAGVACGV